MENKNQLKMNVIYLLHDKSGKLNRVNKADVTLNRNIIYGKLVMQ